MALTISGTGTTIARSATTAVRPFANINVLDSNPDGTAVTVTFTVTDLNGGAPTDVDGTLASSLSAFHKTAIGVYQYSGRTGGVGSTNLSRILSGINFQPVATPSTAIIKIDASDATSQSASDSTTNVVSAVPPTNFIVSDQTTGLTRAAAGQGYVGTVAGLSNQLIVQSDYAALSPHNLNITAVTPNSFIHSGSGTDAIDVSGVGGKNVLDGSTGSNFLTGGRAGTGTDTFFLDDRNAPADVFSTIVNFHTGDDATIFGVDATNFALHTLDNQGAANARGLDFGFSAPGHVNANVVLAGYTSADLASGKLSVTYGRTPDTPGVPGSQYMNIHGN